MRRKNNTIIRLDQPHGTPLLSITKQEIIEELKNTNADICAIQRMPEEGQRPQKV